MKKIILILVVAIVATASNTYAQYATDALRFSQTNYGSTARFKAMGNAQIGVGGDMSSLGGNPAGLGLFSKSEFNLTPEFNHTGINANYLGQDTKTTKGQLNVSQLGVVFYAPTYKEKGQDTKKGLISAVFGVGYNRNNDYSMESNYKGSNTSNSIRTYFAELANASKDNTNSIASSSLEGIAFDSYLINFNSPGSANLYTANPFSTNTQSKNEVRAGSVSEFNLAGALNISNQIYVGASLNFVNIRYTSDAQYTETGVVNPFDNNTNAFTGNENYTLNYFQNQDTKGNGVNGRLGVIFRPVSSLRLGATIQTPTWFVIDDSYSEALNNKLSNDVFNNKPTTYNFTYNLRTPLKGSFGASYIIGGQAIISADVDFVDYASTRFSSNDGGDNDIISSNNSDIRNNYQSAVNYRVGAEYKIDKISLRAGYGLNGSPYKNDPNDIFETKMYSGGLGYRVNNYFFDLAYQKVQTKNTMSPYTLNNSTEPSAAITNDKNNVFLTFGLRF